MPLAEGDIVQLNIEGEVFNQRILLTHRYRVSGPTSAGVPTSAAMLDFLEQVGPGGAKDIITSYKACLPPDYECNGHTAQRIVPNRSALQRNEDSDGPGTYPTGTESSNQTGVITLGTENAGRDQIANKHIGPLPAAAQVNGELSDAYKAILTTLGNKLLVAVPLTVTAQTLTPIIWHGGTELNYTALISVKIGSTVRTQRRRTVGLGI